MCYGNMAYCISNAANFTCNLNTVIDHYLYFSCYEYVNCSQFCVRVY